jgi:CheY-like chemotaxis protein
MKPRPRSSTTVFVVHENCRVSESLRTCLSKAGYRVVAVDSSLSAVALASSRPHDSVDVLLAQPGHRSMSGLHLARWMHQAHSQLRYLELANAAPADEVFPTGCVPLPLEEETLLSRVREFLPPQLAAA